MKKNEDIRTKDFQNLAVASSMISKEFLEWLQENAVNFEELMMLYRVAARGNKGDFIGEAARHAADFIYDKVMVFKEIREHTYFEPRCKIRAEEASVWIKHTPYVPIEVNEKNAGYFEYDLHVVSLGRDGTYVRFENEGYEHKLESGSWLEDLDMIPVQYKTNLPGVFKLLHCRKRYSSRFGNEYLLLTEKKMSMKKFREFLSERGLYPGSILDVHRILDHTLQDIPSGLWKAETVFRQHDTVLCDHGAAGEHGKLVSFSIHSREYDWSKRKAYTRSLEPGQLIFLTDKEPAF